MLSSIRNFIFTQISKFNMFITVFCVLCLIKLRWPKNKSLNDTLEHFQKSFLNPFLIINKD